MRKIIKSKRRQSGFTLIEIIVTVSIATILMSIAIPNYTAMIKNNKVTAITNELISAMILARSEALKRKNNVSVCASVNQVACSGTDFSTGWIVYVECSFPVNGAISVLGDGDCDGDGVNDPDQVIKVHGPIQQMPIAKNNTPGFINFNFAGRVPLPTRFSVTPTGSFTERRAFVTRTGRVRSLDCRRKSGNANPCGLTPAPP